MTTLKLENISYKYPLTEKFAVKDINLEFHSNERCVILGKNGSGKSTMFFIAIGAIKAQEGAVFLDELKIKDKDLKTLRKKIGLVFQDPETQFVAPTVEEEISFGLMNLGLDKEIVKEKTRNVMEDLNIKRLQNRSLYNLSGGEKKLVSIASILVMEPEIIFFDEPTAGIDYPNQILFTEVLKILDKKGIGVVISTHDIDFAWEWSERTVIINDSMLVSDGFSNDILTDKALMEKASLTRPKLVDFSEILGIERVEDYPKTVSELYKFQN